MKTTDFNKAITSAQLRENLEKKFGTNVNLAKYDREQLEDIRNKFRTKIFQQEGSAGINDLLANETYQKDKAMLELLNTRIKEMLGENIKKLRDKMDELSEAKKAKPDFLDMDKDGDKKEPMKKAVADKKKTPSDKKMDEGKSHPKNCKCSECMMQEDPNEGNEFSGELAKAKAAGSKEFKVGDKTFPVKEAAKRKIKDMDEGFDDMEKALKAKNAPKPSGGAGKKAGTSYGGSKQKQEKSKDDDKDLEEGKDEGKPGKNFAKIAKSAGKEYGSKAAGERVAGAVRAKLAKQGKLQESNAVFKHNVKFVNESIGYLLQEDEEGKAKAITAAGDMVNDFTSWMQRVGQYQTKTMIELADAIKADFGAAEAEAFKQAVGPALSATLEVLTQQREAVSVAVAQLAGEAVPEEPMGMEPGMDTGMEPEPSMDMTEPDMMNPEPAGDEFGASDAAAGMGTTGREMRESKFARRLAESHSIMSKLAK